MLGAALGFRVHSGWAAAVAVAGSLARPSILHRARIELIPARVPRQPFHKVKGMPAARAAALLDDWKKQAQRRARQSVQELLEALRQQERTADVAAVLAGSGRPLPELPRILESHALIHTAEGEFFREIVHDACRHCDLATARIIEKTLPAEAARAFGIPAAELAEALAALRREVGPPWTQDEKLAALAAWFTLRTGGGTKAPALAGRA